MGLPARPRDPESTSGHVQDALDGRMDVDCGGNEGGPRRALKWRLWPTPGVVFRYRTGHSMLFFVLRFANL